VGFDISEEFIAQAQDLNETANQDCEFYAIDVYDMPETFYDTFDLVFITVGVLYWLPDIAKFLDICAHILTSGGNVLIYEEHPVANMFKINNQKTDPLKIELPYFNTKANEEQSSLEYLSGTNYEASPRYWFSHTLSSIINSLISKNLQIQSLDEYPHDISEAFRSLATYGLAPLSFILIAKKGC
jgi:SAM-dependent methyltransferase